MKSLFHVEALARGNSYCSEQICYLNQEFNCKGWAGEVSPLGAELFITTKYRVPCKAITVHPPALPHQSVGAANQCLCGAEECSKASPFISVELRSQMVECPPENQ